MEHLSGNMDIKFRRSHPYIHMYHVKGLNNWLRSEKELLIEENKKPKPKEGVENYYTSSKLINEELHSLLVNITLRYYFVGNDYDRSFNYGPTPMVYCQTREEWASIFHNHYKSDTITATTYIDPIDQEHGGGLELFIHEKSRPIIYPEPNHVYFFPAWILHRPLPQSIDTPRLCINWGFNCSVRPIHKLTGDRW